MRNLVARARMVLCLCLLGSSLFLFPAPVANAAPENLPGIDLSGLTAAQKATVLKILDARDCSCACGMKVSECRMKDPGCGYSKGLALVVVDAVRNGKTEAEAIAAADKSQWAHPPESDNRILSDFVKIPTDGAPVIGPADAKIKLVEFSDFQCPYCILATPQIAQLLKEFPNDVSLTFKEFPLEMHSQAALAAIAALAAQKQDKFWPMYNALFAQKGNLNRQIITDIAGKIGLSLIRFQADLNSPDLQKTLQEDLEDGARVGVMGTPTLFVNGQKYNGPVKLTVLKPIIEAELKAPAAKTPATTAQAN